MDTTTFRILDTMSRGLGRPFSINELTKKIKETYGTAHYVNIYEKMHALVRQGIVNLNQLGRSSIVTLNFKNYQLIDLLTEMELKKKHELLRKRIDLQMLFMELDISTKDWYFINSICSVNPAKNIKLNRLELLILLKDSKERLQIQDEMKSVYTALQKLQSTHSVKINYLTLGPQEFLDLLRAAEINPLKEMLSNNIVLISPQAFWIEIKGVMEKGIQIETKESETKLAKITEQDLAYNLARFGYKEIGLEIKQGQRICIEYIISSILMHNEARRIAAIPIILAKNRANYNVLIFLAQKYGLSGRLLGLLKVLEEIKPTKEIKEAIEIMESLGTKEIETDKSSIEQKMRLYNVY